jgi:hypothetical protein
VERYIEWSGFFLLFATPRFYAESTKLWWQKVIADGCFIIMFRARLSWVDVDNVAEVAALL